MTNSPSIRMGPLLTIVTFAAIFICMVAEQFGLATYNCGRGYLT